LKPTNERGFTLVEAMVAMMVLTVGLVSIAEMLAVTLRLQQLGRNETSAARAAQDLLEDLSRNWTGEARIQEGGSLTDDVADHYDHVDHVDGDSTSLGYKRRWVVGPGPDGSTQLREIRIRVIPDLADSRTAAPFEMATILGSGVVP
jgi:prepilin-type N-terminal cleavage/methylation domain-containing protein